MKPSARREVDTKRCEFVEKATAPELHLELAVVHGAHAQLIARYLSGIYCFSVLDRIHENAYSEAVAGSTTVCHANTKCRR